jgi:S1-C subfamily serine protease
MRLFITALIFLLFHAMPASAQWTATAPILAESVVYIESANGSCSGFVINNEKDLVASAAHCDGPKDTVFVDQMPAVVHAKDVKSDLMVFYVKGIDKPALKLATKNPIVGQSVATYGFGYGLEQPLFRTHTVSANDAQIPELSYRYVVVDSSFLPGQSGGPIVDANGNVVAIVQRGNDVIGLGLPVEEIRKRIGKYFSQETK